MIPPTSLVDCNFLLLHVKGIPAHVQLLVFFQKFHKDFYYGKLLSIQVSADEKLPKHALTRRTRVVTVCCVNDLQIMGLWEIFKLQLSLQAMVPF